MSNIPQAQIFCQHCGNLRRPGTFCLCVRSIEERVTRELSMPRHVYEGPMPHPAKHDPKAQTASSKTRLDLIPPAASKACADALAFGAITKGYGPWNWRKSEGVALSVYVAAAKRHLDALMDGEDCAPDSGIHHAGHVMAGMAIILDALKHGKLHDDRVLVSKEKP